MKKINMLVNVLDKRSHINKEIYGHFSEHLGHCIYDGIYVGEDSSIPNTNGVRNDVIEAFRQIHMPVLRWPGGCFADDYHWMDGIGEKEHRKKRINAFWGGVTESNQFGTHDFFNLCEEIGCEPYLAGNVGSGTVRELSDWLEYITFDGDSHLAALRRENGREKPWKLKYLGIGNENWGGGGNMRPEYYADEYRRYQTYCRNMGESQLFKIACGPNADDYHWTERLIENLEPYHVDAVALHYYTLPTGKWNHKGSATDFTEEEYYKTISAALFMDELIRKHGAILRRCSDQIKLAVDEWGCWYDVEPGTNPGFLYQQNTMRDALVAACNLNIFNRHSDIVCMANLAQAVNVLQALLLTKDDIMVKTPTYHVFDLYKTHQDAQLVYSFVENETVHDIPAISQSASWGEDGTLTLTMANCSLEEDYEMQCSLAGMQGQKVSAYILTEEVHAMNDFEHTNRVSPKEHPAVLSGETLSFQLPCCSVVSVLVQ